MDEIFHTKLVLETLILIYHNDRLNNRLHDSGYVATLKVGEDCRGFNVARKGRICFWLLRPERSLVVLRATQPGPVLRVLILGNDLLFDGVLLMGQK